MTIADVLSKIQDSSARSVIDEALKAAEDTGEYNVFLYIASDRARKRAELVDKGELTGSLAGVPFAIKDNFLHLDGPTTAASNFLKDFMAPIQATAVERLEAEGAICIGTVNLDAFAHGGSTENSAYGVTSNAVNQAHVAGGSSGGSAVAVALGVVPLALGTDTGGSIRQPASFNGVVGLKPTYGAVSRFGVIAMASGTDTVGVLSTTADDSEHVLEVIAGQDQKDMTTHSSYLQEAGSAVKKKKIGLIKEFMDDGVDASVKVCVEKAAARYRALGYEVEEVSLPIVKYSLSMYYVIVPAEISSNLARYDGVRYGARSTDATTLSELYDKSRAAGFGAENKRRIMIGSYVLSSGYFDAYYLKAQKARTLLIQAFDDAFEAYDVLIGPVAPHTAFGKGQKTADPLTMYLEDVMTVPASLAGLPAISVPAGLANDMPVGLQIIGPQKADKTILEFAKLIEKELS